MRAGDGRTVSVGRIVASCVAILGLATAIIHFSVAGGHLAEYWLYGVFMLVTAWLQLLWSGAVLARPSRWLLWAGAALNTGVVAVYIVTRTAGDVIGPGRNAAEPLGFVDGLCTALETIVLAGCVWLLATRADQAVRRSRLIAAAATTGSVTAVLLSAALVAGGSEMTMTASASQAGRPMQRHASMPGMATARAVHIRLATATPGGAITMPDPTMQMPPGMQMASPTGCDSGPTAAQRKAAVKLVNSSWKGATKFRSLAVAEAAGYRPITPTGLPVVHYLNVSAYLTTARSGKVLDLAEPQSLVYANTPKGAVLVAAMYITTPGGPTPQPGGCLTQWHLHTNLCFARGAGVVGLITATNRTCPAGSVNRVTPPMMHVWFVPIPGGPTAIDASDAQVVRAAEHVRAPHNGPA
jgi:hypothetical protein